MQPGRKWEQDTVLMWKKATPVVFAIIDNDNWCLCIGHKYLNILCREEVKILCCCFKKTKKVFQFLLHNLSFILTKVFFCHRTSGFFSLAITLLLFGLLSEIGSLHYRVFSYIKNLRPCLTVKGRSAAVSFTMHVYTYAWPFQTVKIPIKLVDPLCNRELIDYFLKLRYYLCQDS